MLHDALWMIERAGHISAHERPLEPARLGTESGAFRRAVIVEEIALAILAIGEDRWGMASMRIRNALALMERLATSLNKELEMRSTPA